MGLRFKSNFDLSQLKSVLNDRIDQMYKGAVKGVKKTVEVAVEEAKDRCPANTGTLKNSITGKVYESPDVIKGSFGTNVEYGPYVEFGTGDKGMAQNHPSAENSDQPVRHTADWNGMPGTPFIYPAFLSAEHDLVENIAEGVKNEMR